MRLYTIYKNCLSVVIRTALVCLGVFIVLCLLSAIFTGIAYGEPPKHAFMLWVERIFRWLGYLLIFVWICTLAKQFFTREFYGILAFFSPGAYSQECKNIDWFSHETKDPDNFLVMGLFLVFQGGGDSLLLGSNIPLCP